MIATFFRRAKVAAAAIATAATILLLPGRASAQVLIKLGGLSYGNDNVQSFFSADGDTFHESDPLALPPWGSAGIGPYAGYSIPPVPTPPGAPIYGSQLPASNTFYGGPYTTNFTDGGSPATTGKTIIASGPVGGSTVASANIHAGLKLVDPNGPPGGYAYEQMDFVADYGTAGPLAGGIGGAPNLIVTGLTTGTGSYAELAGEVDYYWQASNTAFTPNTSSWTPLGSLFYNYSFSGPGVFGPALVAPTGALAATPGGPGVLELIGDFYVAGDPAQIDVESTPEPSSWVLFGIGLATVLVWSARRRTAVAASN